MNYTKHYDILIERAKNRTPTGYNEKHHIVPRCLGGNNKKENIVSLTAREHYVAHQLLVKIHPDHHGLIKAANMMVCNSLNQDRSMNRQYAWIKKKHAEVASISQTGKGNSQYGTCWITKLEVNKKINKNDLSRYLSEGWIKGRFTTNLQRERNRRARVGQRSSTETRAKISASLIGNQNARKSIKGST